MASCEPLSHGAAVERERYPISAHTFRVVGVAPSSAELATLKIPSMARPPSQKGTSVLPVVMALKQHPDRDKIVPRQLWKYFEAPMLVSGWYPERDYWVLIEALVK